MFRTALLLSLAFAQPALALSCLPASVARSTREAVQSDEVYRIVLGTFSFDKANLPAEGAPDAETSVPATFEGNALTRDGFTDPTEDEVVLEVECLMGFCGSVEPGVETLAFLRQSGQDAVLDVNACQGWAFPEPSAEQLDTVLNCLTGASCPAE